VIAVKRWTGTFKPRPVAFTSPFPPAECSRRLQAATARDEMAGYLRPIFTGGPAPRLHGKVSPARVRVARPRGSGYAWFDGTIEQAPYGGTILRGTIAPHRASLPVLLVILTAWSLFIPIALVSGIRFLVAGHPHQALPDLLVPGIVLAFYVIVVAVTPQGIRSQVRRLFNELSEILGSTATMEL
jgi:hypothetical protein